MPGHKCYVVMGEDNDGSCVLGVYSNVEAANNFVLSNNMRYAAAAQWVKDTDAYPAIVLPDRPVFNEKHRPPSNTTSKEYLQWLTNKLKHDEADKEWMRLRVNLSNERQSAIKAKFGECPVYHHNLSVQEANYHE